MGSWVCGLVGMWVSGYVFVIEYVQGMVRVSG